MQSASVKYTPALAKSLLHSLERTADSIGLYVNTDKMESMCFNERGDVSTLNGSSLKLMDKFTYLENRVSSTENDINTRLAKVWAAIDSLWVIWKSDLSDKIKRNFFQAAVVPYYYMDAPHGRRLKRIEKKVDSNYTRMQRDIWIKSWKQHPSKQKLYAHLPPISKTIQIKRIRHAGEVRTNRYWTAS